MSNFPSLPPRGDLRKAMIAKNGPRRPGLTGPADFGPLPWSDYFENKLSLKTSRGEFIGYEAGCSCTLEDPLILLLHGAGYNSFTWALFTKRLLSISNCRILAFDCRDHGDSVSQTQSETLSADSMVQDTMAVYSAYEKAIGFTPSSLVIIGHSMGGSVAIKTAAHENAFPNLKGLIVIDVVEGSAIEALSSMRTVLKSRPMSFRDLRHSIEWAVKSGQTKNLEAARVSMPGQVVEKTTFDDSDKPIECRKLDAINEDEDSNPSSKSEPAKRLPFQWRTNLFSTEQYWSDWFSGMSSLFTSSQIKAPRFLILAGMDRLDKELTIGQMQGKFQILLIEKSGHAVQEDQPDQLATAVATFLQRHKLTKSSATPSVTPH